jgi:hypothetical protein
MASATTRTARGFAVICPECGDPEATVRINLNDLKECECSSCGAEFSARDAAEKAAANARRWAAVCRWVELAGEAMTE